MTSDSEYGDEGSSASDTDGAESRKEKFFCQHCPKSFTFPSNLKRHIEKFHTADFPRVFYQCHICKGKFQCEYHLSNHIRTVHEKMGRTQCKLCSKVFSNNNNLVQHMRYIHDAGTPRILFQCDYCKRQFNRKTNLEYHVAYTACNPSPISRPTVHCPYCDRTMLKKTHLNHKCGGRRRGRNLAQANRAHPPKKINQVFKTKESRENLHRVNNKHDAKMSVKVEAEVNCALGDSIGEPSWAQFDETENENVQRSRRKRNKVDYRLLNGGDTSEPEFEKRDSIEKSKRKGEKKNRVSTVSVFREPVDSKQIESNEGFLCKYLQFLQPTSGDGQEMLNSSNEQSSMESERSFKIKICSSNDCRDTDVPVDTITETQCFVKEEIKTEDHGIEDVMNIAVKIEEFVDDIKLDVQGPS